MWHRCPSQLSCAHAYQVHRTWGHARWLVSTPAHTPLLEIPPAHGIMAYHTTRTPCTGEIVTAVHLWRRRTG